MREKMIELIAPVLQCLPWGQVSSHTAGDIADHLIANGVVISNLETTTDKDTNVPSKWIPVTERLPEYETEVLTYRKSGISVETRWRTYWDYDEFSDSPVTHWMPLPEPAEGE